MEKLTHWTQRSVADFVYNISSNFVSQLETRMEEKEISRSELADRLCKSLGRVSQVFNNPGNLSLRVIVEHARALGMKVSVVAYDDGDPGNESGPINPDVFVKSWERISRPKDLFEVAEVDKKQIAVSQIYSNVPMSFQWNVWNTGNQMGGVVMGVPPAAVGYHNQQSKTLVGEPFSPTNRWYGGTASQFGIRTYPLEKAS